MSASGGSLDGERGINEKGALSSADSGSSYGGVVDRELNSMYSCLLIHSYTN